MELLLFPIHPVLENRRFEGFTCFFLLQEQHDGEGGYCGIIPKEENIFFLRRYGSLSEHGLPLSRLLAHIR
jgi:hypothetical protein